VSSRSYLSIGDVLTLLRQEFPDVTISKIRFLESQGLVNPERTPSGYRKFYEHDVERLRWVLRQQREHFLPLKVIKDRLDEDDGATARSVDGTGTDEDSAPAPTAAPAPSVPPEPAVATEAAVVSHTASATHLEPAPTTSGGGAPRLVAVPDPAPTGEEDSGLEPAARHRAPARATVGATAGHAAPSAASGRAHRPSAATAGDATVANGRGNGSTERSEPTASAASPSRSSKPSKAAAPAAAPTTPARATSGTGGGSDDGGPGVSLGSPGGASLSIEDLCSASGLTVEDVVQLQEYGLLSSSVTAGVEFFDEDALRVADLAGKFAAFGIEARHLRLYKNAADREAGFIEQVVIPMVRQRNPEARARATQTAEDLARLGQQLRGSLLRVALRDLLAP